MDDRTAIRLEVLPARLGDCLLVECLREKGAPWRMLVDGGPPDTWPLLEARLADDPRIDVAVITHIDSDHIGGMIPYLGSPMAASIGDVWFNGRNHLPGPRQRSVAQGESVMTTLLGVAEQGGRATGSLPWNLAFGGGPLDTGEEAGFVEHVVPDGPRITLLSPTTKRLQALAATWHHAVREATRGEEETEVPDVLVPLTDLAAIAAEKTTKDGSLPNGSSIALLLEHRGASVVLGADAFGTVLGAGLTGLAAHRGATTLPVDAFKLPHHGSKGNVLEALLKIAPAQHYVVSSNGDTFHHPDDQAVARVVMQAPRGATLWFNYRNPRTERWADPDLRARHGYRTAYPEDPARGVVLELPCKGAMTQLPWPATHSLLREELLDVPTTVYGDQRLDGPLQALVAGEPQRALALLATQPPDPRSAVVLTAWARQLDRNWYPGDVGAETAVATPDAFVEPQPGDHPIALQLAMLVRRGPPDLRVQRTLMEMSLRAGAGMGVQEALGYAAESVNLLTQYAAQTGQQALLPWLTLVRADFSRRAGLQQDADVLLAQARQQASMLPSPPRLALTYLVEGDWYAAPGASPEGLGWDLAPQNKANPLPPRDLRRAAALWDQAEAQLAGWDVLRLRATLALRRGWQARLAGVPDVQRQYLAMAKDLFLRAGDRASYHLAVVHELVADIEDGRLGQHQLQLGGGWSQPQHGPVAELLQWAATVGSRSWCVGLGRLLQRCGDRWVAEGSAPRARVAYLAALPLVSSDPAVPARALQTAVAHVDGRLSLAVNALLRLDRTFRSPGPVGGNEDLAFSELLDGSASMIGALRDRTRGAAAGITADRMQRLRDDLETARAHTAARLGPSPEGPLPRTLAELEAEVARLQGDGALQTAAEGARHAMGVMVHMNLEMAVSQIVLLDVLIATTRAEAAERAGVRAEAERWYAEARERAVLPGADPFLPTLVELSAGRMDAAAAALALAGDQVSDDLQFPLWVQIGDVERAVATLARLHAAGMPLSDWRSRLSIAELRLAQGDAAAARDEVRQAVEVFAGAVGALLRDPDRLDACDQPDVAALFSVRARASLALGDHLDSLVAAEEARQLVAREREAAVDESAWTEWQRAAAEYASVSHTVLARLAAAPSQEVATFTGLDDADRRLAEAEQTLDQRQPGILLRRAAPPPPPSVPDLQARLPEGAVCLEYLAVGEDFFGWAVTRDALVPSRQPVRYRDLSVMVRSFHAGCSFGRAPDDDLSALLLTPFADLLRTHERVVVVPFAALNLVPFHALSLDGAPLGLSHVVSYAPSLAAAVGGAGLEGAVDLTRPLVVGDPAFDRAARPQLRPLPGSRLEAETVATFLDVQDPLIGDAATEPAVTGRLEDCTLMHISSHGHLDELSPFSSSLVMAGDDELTVAELVGLRFGTSLAVLTGCDTGRGNATLGGDVVGLTRSLLRGGVGQVVVSLWPVDDWVAPVTMQRFYEALRKGLPTAYALTEAQRSVHALDAEALRAAYVAMGGGSDDAQRRGVDLDPELRDDEEPEAPLGGDAERFWAPFVLVG